MTAQASDQVIYRDQGFMLCAFSNSEPFNPSAHGYRPVMASTACYRGYVCEYEVRNSSLQLRDSVFEDLLLFFCWKCEVFGISL